jgi:methionyl-tRNA formyltransferase
MSKTFVFLGSKEIGNVCLRRLLSFCRGNDHTILGVFTNPRGKDILRFCGEEGIPVYEKPDELLKLQNVDYIISVQYHLILKQRHLDVARVLALNLHMAPLPEYRGCNQFTLAIINEDKVFGTTIHKMDTGIDSGDILFESRFPVPEECFVNDLYRLTFEHSVTLFTESLPLLVEGDFESIQQESLMSSRSCSLHFRKEIDELKEISLDWPKEKILRHLRATSMPGFPPPFVRLPNGRIELNVMNEK